MDHVSSMLATGLESLDDEQFSTVSALRIYGTLEREVVAEQARRERAEAPREEEPQFREHLPTVGELDRLEALEGELLHDEEFREAFQQEVLRTQPEEEDVATQPLDEVGGNERDPHEEFRFEVQNRRMWRERELTDRIAAEAVQLGREREARRLQMLDRMFANTPEWERIRRTDTIVDGEPIYADPVLIPATFPLEIEPDNECPVCADVGAELLSLGCRHIVCDSCLRKLPQRSCPTCREPIAMRLVRKRKCVF
jgi:hypothetical protein